MYLDLRYSEFVLVNKPSDCDSELAENGMGRLTSIVPLPDELRYFRLEELHPFFQFMRSVDH